MPSLQFALEASTLVILEQSRTVGVWINGDTIERVELRSTVEHVLVNLAIVSSERRIKLPVREVPSVNKTNSVWTNLLEQLHDGACACQLDLADGNGGRGVELAGFLLKSMEGVEAEELVHQTLGGFVNVIRVDVVEGLVEVLDDHVLGVCAGEAVEVDKEVVPGLLVLVTVLEGFEGQESGTPGKGADEIGVAVENVKGGAGVLAGKEVGEDGGGVVGGLLALEDAAGGLEELSSLLVRNVVGGDGI